MLSYYTTWFSNTVNGILRITPVALSLCLSSDRAYWHIEWWVQSVRAVSGTYFIGLSLRIFNSTLAYHDHCVFQPLCLVITSLLCSSSRWHQVTCMIYVISHTIECVGTNHITNSMSGFELIFESSQPVGCITRVVHTCVFVLCFSTSRNGVHVCRRCRLYECVALYTICVKCVWLRC